MHHDTLIPSFLSPFILASFTFNSHIAISHAGRDFVKNYSDFPIHIYKITQARLSPSQFEEFYSFYNARKGSLYSFGLKDFSDHRVEKQIIGSYTQEARLRFKLFKEYKSGDYSYVRYFSIVIPSSIKTWRNDIEFEARFIAATSEIEIAEALIPNESLKVSFEYDIKVRFITNKIEYSRHSDGSILLNDIYMREVIDV